MRLYKQVYIYFSSYFINAALSFLTVSLLTHHLETSDYGIINLYSSFLIFLTPFITGGILYPLTVEYFKRPEDSYRTFFTNAQVIPLLSLVAFTILCIVFQNQLSHFLKVSVFWIWLMPISVWWIMVNDIIMMISRNKDQPLRFAAFSIGKNVTEIAFTILLVIGLHMTWSGRLSSAAIAPVLVGIISLYFFFHWRLIAKSIDWKIIKQIFLLSIPFVFERLAVFVVVYSDKYFIKEYDIKGIDEVGLYGLGGQVANILSLVIISLNSAYHPHLFKNLAAGFKGKIHKTTWLYILACAACVLGLYIAIPLLFRFFIGKRFQDAQLYAYLLCAGYFMWGVYNAFLGYLLYLEKNRQIFYISLIGMIVSLSLNAFLVPHFGAKGAAITSIITYSIMPAICFLYVRKYFLIKT